MRDISGAYRAEIAGSSVRARAISLYLAGYSACEIAGILRRTTTPASITLHLRQAGLGGVHWCPVCGSYEPV